jgi:hypothetical protein
MKHLNTFLTRLVEKGELTRKIVEGKEKSTQKINMPPKSKPSEAAVLDRQVRNSRKKERIVLRELEDLEY